MNEKRTVGRLLALLLVLCQCVGFLTIPAWAAEETYQYKKLSYKSAISGAFVSDSCYFTDAWFLQDSTARNDPFALLSAQLALTASDAQRGTAFLKTLGFADASARRYESTDPDDTGYTLGTKTLASGATVIAVAFQGADYGDKGWQQNVTVNRGAEASKDHGAYSAAVRAFLEDFSAIPVPEDSILWITGNSRGGAIANLACAYFIDQDVSPALFGYTFEAPATTENTEAHAEKYRSIHNYVCSDDPVAMIPPWGMTRYGEDIVYNTGAAASVTEALFEALGRQNPDAQAYAEAYDADSFGGDVSGYLQGLLGRLTADIPRRADYSRLRTDALPDGTSVDYSYQNGMQALCHLIFGGGGLNEIKDVLTDNMAALLSAISYAVLAERYAEKAPADSASQLAEGVLRRWEAAGFLYDALAKNLPAVTQADLYALARLLGPLLTSTEMTGDKDWTLPTWNEFTETGEMWDYIDLSELYRIASKTNTLLFSHQPDMIIARMKLLAPAPAMDDVALEITGPQAGDARSAAVGEAIAAANALGYDWLGVRSEWLTEDEQLLEGKTYYLRVTLECPGHSVPDGFSFTLNGQAPVQLSVTYPDGAAQIAGVWSFTLGIPRQVTISFDVGGHGETPEALQVNEGEMLRYALSALPEPGTVQDDLGMWRFDGWKGENGEAWDTLTADTDLTLYAAWTRLIDEVALRCDIPYVGDSGDDLLHLRVPDGAPYSLEFGSLFNDSYETVEKITKAERLHINIWVFPEDGAEFLTRDEDGEALFDGVLTINGEVIESAYLECEYDVDGEIIGTWLSAEYTFIPKEREDPSPIRPTPDDPDPSAPDGDDADGETLPFVDVRDDAYYAEAVLWAWKNAITTGTDETHFSPDMTVTRAQMITFLWRAAGCPAPKTTGTPFADVSESDYFCQAVLWAAEEGITLGTGDSRFTPHAAVNRAQAAAFLYRYVQANGGGFTGLWAFPLNYADAAEVPAYAFEAFCFLTKEGVIEGADGCLLPFENCLRGQAVTMLFRLFAK